MLGFVRDLLGIMGNWKEYWKTLNVILFHYHLLLWCWDLCPHSFTPFNNNSRISSHSFNIHMSRRLMSKAHRACYPLSCLISNL